jgi:phytoene/squalene synthetase
MAIYHFARTADDIADEGDASPATRLQQLTAFKTAFLNHLDHQSHAGGPWSQILRNLQKQITAFDLPIELLMALLSAFEQDVVYTRDQRRYATRAELLDDCTRSANPIGRLLMHLYAALAAAFISSSEHDHKESSDDEGSESHPARASSASG